MAEIVGYIKQRTVEGRELPYPKFVPCYHSTELLKAIDADPESVSFATTDDDLKADLATRFPSEEPKYGRHNGHQLADEPHYWQHGPFEQSDYSNIERLAEKHGKITVAAQSCYTSDRSVERATVNVTVHWRYGLSCYVVRYDPEERARLRKREEERQRRQHKRKFTKSMVSRALYDIGVRLERESCNPDSEPTDRMRARFLVAGLRNADVVTSILFLVEFLGVAKLRKMASVQGLVAEWKARRGNGIDKLEKSLVECLDKLARIKVG